MTVFSSTNYHGDINIVDSVVGSLSKQDAIFTRISFQISFSNLKKMAPFAEDDHKTPLWDTNLSSNVVKDSQIEVCAYRDIFQKNNLENSPCWIPKDDNNFIESIVRQSEVIKSLQRFALRLAERIEHMV